MNWKEADVRRLRLRPGDKVVLTSTQPLSSDQARYIHEAAKDKFPDNEVLVLDGLELSVLHEEDAA